MLAEFKSMAPVLLLADETVYEMVRSLEHISAVKIATTLWNRADVRDKIEGNDDDRREAEENVRHYAQALLLPNQTKAMVLSFTEKIGNEIQTWMCRYDNYLPNQLCWTASGSLDARKTALSFVSDPYVDLRYRYEIACKFCFEGYVAELWNQLPELDKAEYCTSSSTLILETTWSHAMKTGGTLGNSFEKLWRHTYFRFHMEFSGGYCKAAVEYLLPKLSRATRTEFLARVGVPCLFEMISPGDHYPRTPNDLAYFLLSQMEGDLPTSYLKHSLGMVIRCLVWPWQTVFLPVAKLLEPFLSKISFMFVLYRIILKVSESAKDYNYRLLFTEFWEQIPGTRKRYVMQELASGCDLLFELFIAGDRGNIKLILHDANSEEQDKIVSHYKGNFALKCYGFGYDSCISKAKNEKMKRLYVEYVVSVVCKPC